MGKKNLKTTKSGKYISPLDQYRKFQRRKELKKNKKQRTTARNNVLSGKDPHQILNELEEIDQQEYDMSHPPKFHQSVLKEKRKKLRESFEKIIKFLQADEPTQSENLRKLLNNYEYQRVQKETAYEQAMEVENMPVDEIPMPEDIQPVFNLPVNTESVDEQEVLDMATPELKFGKPPPPPLASPPDLSSDDEMPIKLENYWQTCAQIGSKQQFEEEMRQYEQNNNFPYVLQQPGLQTWMNPNYDEPYYPVQYPSNPYYSEVPQPNNVPDYTPANTTIEAKPKLRNLREAATCFMPTTLRVQRQYKDDKGRLRSTSGMRPKHSNAIDPLAISFGGENTTIESKDEAYERFMKEIDGLL